MAPHLLVFAAWDDYTPERINAMFDYTNEVRGFKNEGWENYRNMLLSTYPQRGAEVNHQHAARQAYIGMSASSLLPPLKKWTAPPWKASTPPPRRNPGPARQGAAQRGHPAAGLPRRRKATGW